MRGAAEFDRDIQRTGPWPILFSRAPKPRRVKTGRSAMGVAPLEGRCPAGAGRRTSGLAAYACGPCRSRSRARSLDTPATGADPVCRRGRRRHGSGANSGAGWPSRRPGWSWANRQRVGAVHGGYPNLLEQGRVPPHKRISVHLAVKEAVTPPAKTCHFLPNGCIATGEGRETKEAANPCFAWVCGLFFQGG
jgi:hypothetical protein